MGEIYSGTASRRTYERLHERAAEILDAGWPVVLDATFLQRNSRRACRRLAEERGVPFMILAFRTDESLLRERVQRRRGEGCSVSDADLQVLQSQLESRQPLSDSERSVAVEMTAEGAAGEQLRDWIDGKPVPPPGISQSGFGSSVIARMAANG
jgi:hypothetical protein